MNKYLETGTIFRKGDLLDTNGGNISRMVRKVMADHQRSLQGPYGPMAGKRVTNLLDGTVIVTWVNPYGLAPTLVSQVYTPVGLMLEEEVLCDFISGWFNWTGLVAGAFSELFLRNADGTYGPEWVNSRQVVSQMVAADAPCNTYVKLHDSMVGGRGSQYTGRMREVIQVLGGMNYPIPYNYQWCETHGIFINQVSGIWWVVEIKEASGVRAWKLPVCRELTPDEQEVLGVALPNIPLAVDIFTIENSVELLSSAALGVAYANAAPFYTEHGWAFSYDGSEACLISITWPDTYQISTVWKIEITADENGDPVAASLDEIASDYLWMPRAWAPKYPHFTSNGPTLLSYDSTYGESSGPETNNAPLDVFYRPDSNTPVIVRHDSLPSAATSTESATWPLPSGTFCTDRIPAERASGTYHTGDKDTTRYETPEISFGALGRPIGVEQVYTVEYNDKIYYVSTESKAGAAWVLSQVGQVRVYDAAITINSIEYYGGATLTQYYNEVFFKPLLEREMVGLYAQQKKHSDYGSRYDSSHDFLVGGYYGPTNVSYSYPSFGCGANEVHIYSASGDCETAQNWNHTSLGDAIVAPTASPHELNQVPQFAYIPDGCYTGADRPCLWACDIGGYFQTSCAGSAGAASTTEETDISTDVFLFNNKTGGWVHVYAEEECDTMDDFTSYIDAEDVAIGGAVPFWAHLDVFTGQGMTTKFINQNDPSEMHYWGSASTVYPLGENGPSTNVGWIGIPLLP